jgi:hypothetical protein
MDYEKRLKKGDIVTATRTYNGEEITGEFRGFKLFNDENPYSVVGVVWVHTDGIYDVSVDSIKPYASEAEKTRKKLIRFISSPCVQEHLTPSEDAEFIVFLERASTEGDFGRGYDCGYQAGFAMGKLEKMSKETDVSLVAGEQKPDKCPYYAEGYGCGVSPQKSCLTCYKWPFLHDAPVNGATTKVAEAFNKKLENQ